jgi:hypothetical protein
MKIEPKGNVIVLKEVFAGVTLETKDGKQLQICERENGFDVKFGNGRWNRIDDETDVVVNQPKHKTSKVTTYFIMERSKARHIAETITNEQLKEMLDRAKENIKDWSKVSTVNKGITKGTAWNILGSNFDVSKEHHILTKTNMVREFGEFLSEDLKPKKKEKVKIIAFHQDPKF